MLSKGTAEKFNDFPNQSITSWIDTTAKLIPIGYIALTFIGCIYQSIYYSVFNLNIFEYLQISEVLTLSISINSLIVVIMTSAFMALFLISRGDYSRTERKILSIIRLPLWKRHRISLLIHTFPILIILCCIIFYISFIEFFNNKNNGSYMISGAIAACIHFLFLTTLIIELIRVYHERNGGFSVKLSMTAQMANIALSFYFFTIVYKVLNIRSHKQTNIELYSSDSFIKVPGKYSYIGKTDKYIIVSDSALKKTVVYSIDSIKKIVFL